MEFTSGGTGGPKLDAAYADLDHNYYASLVEPRPLAEFAEALHRAGWGVRKSSWTEYEVSCAWAQLYVMPPGVLSGIVAPGHRERFAALVAGLGFACRADPEDDPDVEDAADANVEG